jgi:hypothetical protein
MSLASEAIATKAMAEAQTKLRVTDRVNDRRLAVARIEAEARAAYEARLAAEQQVHRDREADRARSAGRHYRQLEV